MSENRKLSRRECRELIFKLLFAKEFDREADPASFYADFIDNTEEPTAEYVENVFTGVCAALPELDAELEAADEVFPLHQGESWFLPAGLGEVKISGRAQIIVSEVN